MSARSYCRFFVGLSLVLTCLASTGCNPLTVVYFLLLLPTPKVEAACKALEKQKVVVMTYASRSAQFEHAGIDNDLAKGVVRELRENVKGIKLVDPNEVRQWRDEHSDFELTDVGRAFKAGRVLYIEIESFSLYEAQTTQLYRGSAKIHLQVADMEKDGEIVWDNIVEPQFPGHRPIPTSDMSRDKFRSIFTKYLTRQIAHNFFEYRPDEDFTVN
ncbi:MAG: hypothetical protein HY000_15875 [Planctomycetes bacterium]|nr:hypothetical protein [Planctomycetota bacterium]